MYWPYRSHSMKGNTKNNWQEANQQSLMAALAEVREALEAKVKGGDTGKFSTSAPVTSAPALDQVCTTCGLSLFERDVLLLCAGMDLDSNWASLCAEAQGDSKKNYPTLSLALAVLREPCWSALTPAAPLRRWRLIELGTSHALTTAPLRLDERILHYLAGVPHLDERLMGIMESVRVPSSLIESHRQLAEQLAATWRQASDIQALPIVQLCGDELASKRAIAAAACSLLGFNLDAISAHAIPTSSNELYQLLQLWRREAALSKSVLLLDCDDSNTTDTAREDAIALFIERISSPLIMTTRDRRPPKQRPMVTFDVHKPTTNEQRAIWNQALGEKVSHLNGLVDTLVSQFNLNTPGIHAASVQAMGKWNAQETERLEDEGNGSDAQPETQNSALSTLLWDTCRSQARPQMNDLAQHIESSATWNDLVLPERERLILRDIAAHLRQRAKVYESWGFAGKGGRGLGISALFAGASGTGKTMAAEVLAGELRLDLYRIDLSSVVSKYIGETEKNLRRVFDAADEGGAILLFDEADALFGKRSEVKDSHDRYANIEISYLLQRMEAYRGLAILTTNLKHALDPAFLRRLRFVVWFPFPDAAQRAAIWRRIFPPATPTEGLDAEKLARLNVPGGNIRNIALGAAFLAAEAGEPVRMLHLLRAARGEYAKLEKPLSAAEIAAWE